MDSQGILPRVDVFRARKRLIWIGLICSFIILQLLSSKSILLKLQVPGVSSGYQEKSSSTDNARIISTTDRPQPNNLQQKYLRTETTKPENVSNPNPNPTTTSLYQNSLQRLLSKRNYDVCVVGAGLSGAVIAERYANLLDQNVLILEKRPHIGGNCYDFMDPEVHLRVSQYGAHLFHTKHERVWDYVQKFANWTPYEHKVVGLVDEKYVPIPVNIDTVNILFGLNITSETEMDAWLQQEQVHYDREPENAEQVALSRVGPRLYEKIFRPYTQKQWARDPSALGPEVTRRIPVRNNFDGRYFGDPHQALPREGYTNVFEHMLANHRVEVHTGVDYFEVREALNCTRTYYTGPIDAYFAHLGWETLQYRSIDFERRVEDREGTFQQAFVVNHPYEEANFTRIVEYKHLPNQPASNKTVYFIERSSDVGEPYYPVPNKRNKDLFARYQSMAQAEKNVTFVGRLANYKYFNMDDAILNALELFDKDAVEALPKTHWCVISKKTGTLTKYFDHFPHASENLLPCWSWFRSTRSTGNCGILLLEGLPLKNSWQKQLVDAMGCQVRQEKGGTLTLEFIQSLLGSNVVVHIQNRKRALPRWAHKVYLDRVEDAQALRRLVGVSDRFVREVKGGTHPLQIGLIQRLGVRKISNLDQIAEKLQQSLPTAQLETTLLNTTILREQASFFASKDVIIGAHGAALMNSLFVTPGTFVMQVYPEKYFWRSLDSLIEQAGGIALDYYEGRDPHREWAEARERGEQNRRRDADITVDVDRLVDSILFALGEKVATVDNMQIGFS